MCLPAMDAKRAVPVFLLFISTICVASCSIKEDRSRCPCHINVSVAAVPEGGAVFRMDDGLSLTETRIRSDTSLKADASGAKALVTAHNAPEWSADGYRIPVGEQSPPLYLCAKMLQTAAGESAEVSLTLRKSYCLLRFSLSGEEGPDAPYTFRVRGNVNGVHSDGSPSEGQFFYDIPPSDFCVRLPRQKDNSLLLDIVAASGTVRTFALGTCLHEASYDWTKPDLDDAALDVELSLTEVHFTLGMWTATVQINHDI